MMYVEIINDQTAEEPFCNYNVRTLVNGAEIWTGRVERHYRADGWPELLRRIAAEKELQDRIVEAGASKRSS